MAELDLAGVRRKLERERRAREQAESLLETRAAELRAGTLWLEEATVRLAANQQHLQAVLDAAEEAILTFNEAGVIHGANLSCETLFRFKPDEMQGLSLDRLIPELKGRLGEVLSLARQLAAKGDVLRNHVYAQTAGAQVFPIVLAVRPVESTPGHEIRYVALIADRSKEHAMRAHLQELLEREQGGGDELAPLQVGSHTVLHAWCEEQARDIRRDGGRAHVAMICCNLDRFKRVNNKLGLLAGDGVMACVIARLSDYLSRIPVVPAGRMAFCRLYADQFILACVSDRPAAHLADWVQGLRTNLGAPLEAHAQRFVFSVSVGAALGEATDTDVQALVMEAEFAMCEVKRRGGNGYQAYCPVRDQPAHKALAAEHNVILGIERQEFQPFFQPKVSAQSGDILGFEALMRWRHPQRGLIPLSEFLPVLENSSLMLDAGLQIFEQVVKTMAAWQARGCELPVSFNLSNGELLSDAFRRQLVVLAGQAGVPCSSIYLEITETVVAHLGATADPLFSELVSAGFRLSMDDFGVGSSSLSRIKSVPLHEIKIDRSFVQGIDQSQRDRDLLLGIVNLARGLGLEVVLEGVETSAQLDVACSLGRLAIQGFYFSPAVDAAQAWDMVQRRPFAINSAAVR